MYFYIPTKIYQQDGCVRAHGQELAALGSRALIVTGKHSSRKNGSLSDVVSALEAHGIPFLIFDDIEENPSVETVIKAKEAGLSFGADFVIGIGGGSPMDASKSIALLMKHPEETADFLYARGDGDSFPVAAVPTTCGTGSEATPWSILTRHELKIKQGIARPVFPSLALCDPGYLAFAPHSVLVSTAIDAFSHCVESYINANATPYSRMLCLQSLRLWGEAKGALAGNRAPSPQDLSNLMCASTLAGMAISHTSTSLPHGLSYYLTYDDSIPHGLAVGVFQVPYLAAAGSQAAAPLLTAAGFADLGALAAFLTPLTKQDIPQATRERAIRGMMGNESKLKNCPFAVSEKLLEGFFGENKTL